MLRKNSRSFERRNKNTSQEARLRILVWRCHLEKRLKMEFMKMLVYPNSSDEVFPFLNHIDYTFDTLSLIHI